MATVGYVLIEHFAVAVERRRRPELVGRPVVIGGYPHERKSVYDASSEAEAAGVKPGLPLRQAEHLCPTAVFIPLAKPSYEEAAAAFLAVVESFSPAVLPSSLGGAYFDARGLARLFPGGSLRSPGGDLRCGPDHELARRLAHAVEHRLGLLPCVGLGPSRFTARIGAHLSRPGAPIIVEGDPATFLADLPVDFLTGDDSVGADVPVRPAMPRGASYPADFYDTLRGMSHRLRLLGIHTIGQFMRLPSSELMEQFGTAGVELYRLAYGRDDPPILPRSQPSALQQTKCFEPPLTPGPSLAQAINRLSAALAMELQQRYQACQTVILRLELSEESLEQIAQLKEPTAQSARIAAAALRLSERMRMESAMETLRFAQGDSRKARGDSRKTIESGPEIVTVQIVVSGLVTQGGTQLGLFDAQRQRRTHLAQAIDEIQRRFGDRLKHAEPAPALASAAAPAFVLRDYGTCPTGYPAAPRGILCGGSAMSHTPRGMSHGEAD